MSGCNRINQWRDTENELGDKANEIVPRSELVIEVEPRGITKGRRRACSALTTDEASETARTTQRREQRKWVAAGWNLGLGTLAGNDWPGAAQRFSVGL
jgi:hypothetical protein